MGFPLYVTCCFSLAAFNFLSLCLVFVSLISMCLGMFLFGFILYGTLCFLDLIDYFLFCVGEIFNYSLFKNFLIPPLFFSLLLLYPLLLKCWCVWYCPGGLWDYPQVLFILFMLFCSSEVISTILSSRSLIHSSASNILLLIPSRNFLILVIVLFISACLFF